MRLTKTSLRQQLLLWLLLPQLVFCLAGAALFLSITLHYADNAIDKRLIKSANAVAKLIQHQAQISPELSSKIIATIDSLDDLEIFAIHDGNQRLIAGRADLVMPQMDQAPSDPFFYYQTIDGQEYRVLMQNDVAQSSKTLQIAFNLHERDIYTRNIFLSTAIPLLLLIIITIFFVWWGIGRGLRPLAQLQSMMELRKPQDLSPLALQDAPRELNALSAALNHLLATTEASIDRQRRFIADAAHQLRTPLAGLKSQTELAMRENSPEGLRERLNMVHTSATRSIHLVNQLLTLARSEPGSQNSIPKVHMDLAKIIRDLTAELVPRALAARIDLGCDCFVQDAPLHGNSALLREMFINLVENAIKYIPRDGSVTVRLTEDEKNYIVDVEDNGPGIPDSDKDRVFERFYRREQTGNGCGLGMAIVREIAERHAGSVQLRDADPHGLIVHVVLPKTELNT